MKRVVILLGCPGAGKGTQSRLLSECFDLPQISMGDILRSIAAREGSQGDLAGEMSSGKLLDDHYVSQLLAERLARADCDHGYILDGYPRSIAQAVFLDGMLDGARTIAVEIAVNRNEILPRLETRRQCPSCGAVFSVSERTVPLNCERCGQPAAARTDDTADVILRRFSEYERRTSPVLRYYAKRGVLHWVEGSRPVEEVFNEIRSVVLGHALYATASSDSPPAWEGALLKKHAKRAPSL
jgi:adenylate kinase